MFLTERLAERVARRRRGDDGFTLVELLVAIVIIGVIVAPLTAGLILFLRNTDVTVDRMAESHDGQITAAYFTQDVQSIGVRDWNTLTYNAVQSIETPVAPAAGLPATTGLYPCHRTSGGTPDALVRFAWDDPAASGPQVLRVAYFVETVGSGATQQKQLHRLFCDQNGNAISETVLAHFLAAANPQIACATSSGAPAACGSAPPPATVTLTLVLKAPNGPGYTVTLQGQRRQA